MLILQDILYMHPSRDVLFDRLNLTINTNSKAALVGNNGSGKSTLLKLFAGSVKPSAGTVYTSSVPYNVPQHFGQYDAWPVARALGVDGKLGALRQILAGEANETNFAALNDDWTIEERCHEALSHWELENTDLAQPMNSLSGGQKTKVFLAGMHIHQPGIILMDEPSNHLDRQGRILLYDFIQRTSATLLVVSHDRKLLEMLHIFYELSRQGIAVYGGDYAFYREQKAIESDALQHDIKSKELALRKARQVERETVERKQKLDSRGKKKQEKAGVPKIMMNTLRNSAEKSTARIRDIHAEKTGNLLQELNELRKELPGTDKMKFGFDHSALHKGKVLIQAQNINAGYDGVFLWQQPLNVAIASGERIAIKGNNGSGKTTLVNILLGKSAPLAGSIQRTDCKAVYIDQNYSLVDRGMNVYELAQQFNPTGMQEHEIKIRLNRFLFTPGDWDKPCSGLSGGERMRLALCCLTISHHAPDMIILDEPTNNLDMQNIEILTAAIHEYEGTLIVISHDDYFLQQLNVERFIALS